LLFLQFSIAFGQYSFEIIVNDEENAFLTNGKQDNDGNFILVGRSFVPTNKDRAYHRGAVLMKVDSLGQYIMTTLRFADTNCLLKNVMLTQDSNYLFIGHIGVIDADSNKL